MLGCFTYKIFDTVVTSPLVLVRRVLVLVLVLRVLQVLRVPVRVQGLLFLRVLVQAALPSCNQPLKEKAQQTSALKK